MKKKFVNFIICLIIFITTSCASKTKNESMEVDGAPVFGNIYARIVDGTNNIDEYFYAGMEVTIQNQKTKLQYQITTMGGGQFFINCLNSSESYKIVKIAFPDTDKIEGLVLDTESGPFIPMEGKYLNLGIITITINLASGDLNIGHLGFNNIDMNGARNMFITQNIVSPE